jgi:hypothetical protein
MQMACLADARQTAVSSLHAQYEGAGNRCRLEGREAQPVPTGGSELGINDAVRGESPPPGGLAEVLAVAGVHPGNASPCTGGGWWRCRSPGPASVPEARRFRPQHARPGASETRPFGL